MPAVAASGTVRECTIADEAANSSEIPALPGLRPVAIYCANVTGPVTFTLHLRVPDSGLPGVTPVYKVVEAEGAVETIAATDDVWVHIPLALGILMSSGPCRLVASANETAGPITIYVRYAPF